MPRTNFQCTPTRLFSKKQPWSDTRLVDFPVTKNISVSQRITSGTYIFSALLHALIFITRPKIVRTWQWRSIWNWALSHNDEAAGVWADFFVARNSGFIIVWKLKRRAHITSICPVAFIILSNLSGFFQTSFFILDCIQFLYSHKISIDAFRLIKVLTSWCYWLVLFNYCAWLLDRWLTWIDSFISSY